MNALRVVHEIPGRLRLRVPPAADLASLADAVRAEPGVTGCTWSPRTRSLLVLYDPDRQRGPALANLIARQGRFAIDHASPLVGPIGPGGVMAAAVRDGFGAIDDRVRRVTRGLLGLGTAVPVALAAWTLGEIVRGRTAPLSWSSALWYAHGLFRDYAGPASRE